MIRDWIRSVLTSAGYVVFNSRSRVYYAQDSLFTTNNDNFRDDPVFKAAYSRGVKASGGVDPQIEWRVHVALWAARNAVRVPGDFVECGVNAGFVSSAIMPFTKHRSRISTSRLVSLSRRRRARRRATVRRLNRIRSAW